MYIKINQKGPTNKHFEILSCLGRCHLDTIHGDFAWQIFFRKEIFAFQYCRVCQKKTFWSNTLSHLDSHSYLSNINSVNFQIDNFLELFVDLKGMIAQMTLGCTLQYCAPVQHILC